MEKIRKILVWPAPGRNLKKNDDKVAATADVSAFMPVQAGQNLHERNTCLAGDETSILQIVPPRTAMFLS